MSSCISSHGEYSDHQSDAGYCCQRCFAFDEDAALARIRELEAEVAGIKRRDDEVGEDEGWWVGGAWGDYGEVVVPLRILSYVIDGKLDERVSSIDPGFALTYAEQTARAEAAEAKIDAVRAGCVARTDEYPDDPYDFVREFALVMLAVLDGEDRS